MSHYSIYKYTLAPYGRNDQNEAVCHYCSNCKEHHTIPRKNWLLLVKTNRITKRQTLRLVCKMSLWEEELKKGK